MSAPEADNSSQSNFRPFPAQSVDKDAEASTAPRAGARVRGLHPVYKPGDSVWCSLPDGSRVPGTVTSAMDLGKLYRVLVGATSLRLLPAYQLEKRA